MRESKGDSVHTHITLHRQRGDGTAEGGAERNERSSSLRTATQPRPRPERVLANVFEWWGREGRRGVCGRSGGLRRWTGGVKRERRRAGGGRATP